MIDHLMHSWPCVPQPRDATLRIQTTPLPVDLALRHLAPVVSLRLFSLFDSMSVRVLRNLSIIYRILYVVSGPIGGRLRKSGLYQIRMRQLSSYPRRRRTGGAGPLLYRR